MAGERIFQCRNAKHPTNAIAGVTHARIPSSAVTKTDQGRAAGTTGRKDTLLTHSDIRVELFARDVVYCLRSATHGGAVADVVYARVVPSTVFKVDQGAAGAPGPADALVTHKDLMVELYGLGYAALLGLLGTTAATLTLNIEGAAGADQSIAITNVYFSEPIGAIELPAKDSGGNLVASGVRGYATFGDAESWADIITATPTVFTGLLTLIGATAANLVIGTEGAAGANEKHTIKNVYFTEPVGGLEIPAKDVGGGLQTFGVRGVGLWGATDTWALMIVGASDA